MIPRTLFIFLLIFPVTGCATLADNARITGASATAAKTCAKARWTQRGFAVGAVGAGIGATVTDPDTHHTVHSVAVVGTAVLATLTLIATENRGIQCEAAFPPLGGQ